MMKIQRRLLKSSVYGIYALGVVGMLLTGCGEGPASSSPTTPVQAATTSQPLASVKVQNALNYAIADAAISVELTELGLASSVKPESYRFITDDQTVPHQFIDSDGDGIKDHALLMLDLAAVETVTINMLPATENNKSAYTKRTHAEISIKTGGHWNEAHYEGGVFQDVESVTVPPQYTDHSEYIRYEGPGIESDKVGYRVYLDWRNGFDIFGKRELGLHLANVGLDGYASYHEASAWGQDILKVGKSVGVGGFGYWNNGAVERLSNVEDWTASIIEDGDLYSAFAIDYQGWNTGSDVVDLRAQLSMQAGSSAVTVDIKTSPSIEQLAVGIVKHDDTVLLQGDLDITGEAWSYIATLGKQSLDGQQLLMYVLFKRETFNQLTEDEFNHVVLLKVRGGELSYQFGTQWAAEPGADLSPVAVKTMLQKAIERRTFSPRLSIANANSDAFKKQLGGIESALKWSTLAAESEIKRHGNELAYGEFDTMRERAANWEYTMGMMTQSIYQVGKANNNDSLKSWAKAIVDSYVNESGDIATYNVDNYNIDSINSGKMLLELYNDTGEEKYRIAAGHLRDQLRNHPRLDLGAFWHKKRYPYQLWLDGVYMGMPFLAEYTTLFENGAALDEVVEEFRVARDHLRDPATGLYFHALDEKKVQQWAAPETGLSHYFWSRGMGWLAMAIIDTLDFIPEDHTAQRTELTTMAKDLIDALLKFQDEDGVWYQITDRVGDVGNYQEASASSMYTYLLVKGVAKGVLPESYKAEAEKSYDALIQEFVLIDADNNLDYTQNCQVGGLGFGRDGSYEYYMSEPIVDNDPKGLAPFMMLGPIAAGVFTQ